MWSVIKIIRGIIFCHVERIKHENHEIAAIVLGSQKWQGANPSLYIVPPVIKIDLNFIGINEFKRIIPPSRIRAEPMAWVIKYLIAPSVSCKFIENIIIGINLSKLSSNPSHSRSQ